mgnify:CR=1 FL=1
MLSFLRSILLSYRDLMLADQKSIVSLMRNPGLPKIEESRIVELCKYSIEILKRQSTLARLNGPVVVIGDLHGSIVDLLRIFGRYGLPFMYESDIKNTKKYNGLGNKNGNDQHFSLKYVFLGDYVDRGEFSVEVMTVLLSAFCLYPNNIILLRGNHEFLNISTTNSFKSEILSHPSVYSPEVFQKFQDVFSYLPYSAVVNDNIFCVHGGLSSKLTSLKDIEKLSDLRPIYDYKDNTLIQDLVWSDPSKIGCCQFIPSTRNQGCIFGSSAVNSFYKNTGIRAIIRGHSYVKRGIEIYEHINLISVFSSSSYLKDPIKILYNDKNDEDKKNIYNSNSESDKSILYPQSENISYDNESLCGTVFINENSEIIPETFEAVEAISRKETKLISTASIGFASSQTLCHSPINFKKLDSNESPQKFKKPDDRIKGDFEVPSIPLKPRNMESRRHRASDTRHNSSNDYNLVPNSPLWKPKKKFSLMINQKKDCFPAFNFNPNS